MAGQQEIPPIGNAGSGTASTVSSGEQDAIHQTALAESYREISQLKEEKSKVKAEKERLEAQVDFLEGDNTVLNVLRTTAEADLAASKKEIAELKRQLAAATYQASTSRSDYCIRCAEAEEGATRSKRLQLDVARNRNQPGTGLVVIEQFEVPDTCVGLIIGHGGEIIANIQNQTGCRLQMSSFLNATRYGIPMRGCTLTGSKPSIDKAKEMMQAVIEKAGGTPPPNRNMGGVGNMAGGGGRVITHEILVPSSKCGLVIGKGGETIKILQEKAGVKMVMIQDSNQATGMPKPLHIIGEQDKVEYAKRLVEDVMASKDYGKPGGMMNDYGGGAHNFMPKSTDDVMIIVPRTAVGVIIGRGGENIRRLTQDTGAKIQFKQGEDANAMERTAVITGTPDQIQKAKQLITDMVNRAVAGGGDGGGGGGGYRKSGEADVFYMHVPSAKTGLL